MDRKFISFIDFTNLNDEDKYKLLILRENKLDKAIEYINTHEYPSMYCLRENDLSKKELLDILKEDK